MGMMGVFKWLRKDIIQRDRHRRSLSSKLTGLNNESYRTALHAFLERRKNPNDPGYIMSPESPERAHLDFLTKKIILNETCEDEKNEDECNITVTEAPNARASEIFEIGYVAGTEDRYMHFIYAEWQNTKVCLRKHTHPDCKNAVEADLNVLRKIRHPNVLLLMGTSHTKYHGMISIFEPIDCTLFNYIHDQGERVAVQGIAKCIGNLAAALKYSHMLGYIHTAISPHCVFLSSNGIVKLGGWELATNMNKANQVRTYENRLRTEIFRWQAPELFVGQEASTAADVYGLSLLMWEMCTMNIPWIGLSFIELKKYYGQKRHGVIVDLSNFPPILNTLLEVGLQLDVTKRTLSMMEMSRFLQRLEMLYEDVEPIFIEQSMKINGEQTATGTLQNNITSSRNNFTVHKYRLSNTNTDQYSEGIISRSNQRTTKKIMKSNSCIQVPPDKSGTHVKSVCELLQTDVNENTQFANVDLIKTVQGLKTQNSIHDVGHKMHKMNGDNQKVNDSRISIEKLKETLANRRENFFYGGGSLCDTTPSIDDQPNTFILSRVRNKNCEPHKPASHKTSLQPKLVTCTSPLPATVTKSMCKKNHRSPYSYVPIPVRNAVIQPQILNPDSQSFFETSLWQKEKMICLLEKRRRDARNHNSSSQYHNEDMKIQKKKKLPTSDETFTIDVNSIVENTSPDNEQFTPINESIENLTVSTIPRSKSLQALKDALERATDIVRSTTPITSTTTDISLCGNTSETTRETVTRIEHATTGVGSKMAARPPNECKYKQKNSRRVIGKVPQDALTNAIATVPLSSATSKKSQYVDIVTNSSEYEVDKMKEEKKNEIMSQRKNETGRCTSRNTVNREVFDGSFASFNFGNTETTEYGCSSCSKNSLVRRRSLPTELSRSKSCDYQTLKKSSAKESDLPDATFEDLYIDDEFDEISLAPNMILMDEDTISDDENYFPDLLESKRK